MEKRISWNGARASLMDRLIEDDPHLPAQNEVRQYQSQARLKESVREEIERLFNTRTLHPSNDGPRRSLTVLDYGVPDYSAFYPIDEKSKDQLRKSLQKALVKFEPRLQDVKVAVKSGATHDGLLITIEAKLVPDRDKVSYPVLIKNLGALIEIHTPDNSMEVTEDE